MVGNLWVVGSRRASDPVDLGEFVGRADYLLDCSLLRSGALTGEFTLQLQSDGLKLERAARFDREAFEAFVQRLRPFSLEHDSICLTRVWPYLERTLPEGQHRAAAQGIRVTFFREIRDGLPRLAGSDFRGGRWQDSRALYDLTVTMMTHAKSDNMAEWESLGAPSQWVSYQSMLMMSQLMVSAVVATRALILQSRTDGLLAA